MHVLFPALHVSVGLCCSTCPQELLDFWNVLWWLMLKACSHIQALIVHAGPTWPATMSAADPEWSKLFTSWDRPDIKECLKRPAPSPLPKGGPLDHLLKTTCQLLRKAKQSPAREAANKAVPCHGVRVLATIQHWLQKTPNDELLQLPSHWWTVTATLAHLVIGSGDGNQSQLTRSCWEQLTQPEGKHLVQSHHCHLQPTEIVPWLSQQCGDLCIFQ